MRLSRYYVSCLAWGLTFVRLLCLRELSLEVIGCKAPFRLSNPWAPGISFCPHGELATSQSGAEGNLTLQRLVQTYSETPARLLGLYPRKGALRIGSDAGVVLVDTEQEHVLSNDNIVSKAGWTPFDGRRVKGRPVMTMLRGQLVAENGKVVAEPGGGRFTIRR